MAKIQNVRGTYDLYGEAKRKTKKVIATGGEIVEKYGFEEIETPIFEFTEVFSRNLGDTSDIVTKEMYCFQDRGGESLTLRPEGTAGVVRSFISEGMQQNLPVKLYYAGPMFRYERPQKGRQRQFTQFGVELLGVENPQADIEVISMAYEFVEKLGLAGSVTVEINSLGDQESVMPIVPNWWLICRNTMMSCRRTAKPAWKKIRCACLIPKKTAIKK